MDDHRAIEALYARMCRAWTDGDAVAHGGCFTDDCAYVAFDGSLAVGRDAVIESHEALFRGVLFGSALVGGVDSIHRLGPDAALVHGTGAVQVAWRSRPPRRRVTRSTLVAERGPDGWRFAAIHNGRIRPVAVPAPDSPPARMARALVRLTSRLGIGRSIAVR